MTICTAAEVREIANISTTRADNTTVTNWIGYATQTVNREIGIRVADEEILPIDNERENDINGSNTTYYLATCGRGPANYVGDRDNDGDVTTADIEIYSLDSSGTRATVTISSVDDEALGKLTVSSAPTSGYRLFASYVLFPLPQNHDLIKLAVMNLSASLGYDYLEIGQLVRVRTQGMQVFRHTSAGDVFYDRYKRIRDAILSSRLTRIDESDVVVPKLEVE